MIYLERIGGVLVAPREAMRQIAAGDASGMSATVVAWLIAARVVAGETPRLARAVVRGLEGGVSAALSGIVSAFAVVLPDVLGILTGAILLSFFAARRKPDRTLDVAAAAWIPYLGVQLFAALLFTALGRPLRLVEQYVVDGAAVGWALVVWGIGLRELRRA
jgi:hypothetical protein